MTREDLVSKIQKLLRLGESSNVNEAAAAMAMAQKLMDENRICKAELNTEQDDPEVIGDSDLDNLGGKKTKWKVRLAVILAENNNCKIYTRWATEEVPLEKQLKRAAKGKPVYKHKEVRLLRVIGRDSDVQALNYMYAYLVKEIKRLCKEETGGLGLGFKFREEWRHGALDTIDIRLRAQREIFRESIEMTASKEALVKFDDAKKDVVRWTNQHLRLKKSRSSLGPRSRDDLAREMGQVAAKDISLGTDPSRGIGQGAARLKS